MHIGIYILEYMQYMQYICNICNMHIAVPATLSVRLDISEEEGAGGAFVAIAICNMQYMLYAIQYCYVLPAYIFYRGNFLNPPPLFFFIKKKYINIYINRTK